MTCRYFVTAIRIRLYIKNETSLKKRNLERNRPKKTQPRRRQVSEKKKRNLPEGQVSEKKRNLADGQVAFFLVISAP